MGRNAITITAGEGMEAIVPLMSVLLINEFSNAFDSWYSFLLNGCQMKEDRVRGQQVRGVLNKIGSTFDWVPLWTSMMTCTISTTKSL